MKSFIDILKEEDSGAKHHVMTFGRMNPPTTGHLKLIDKVKEVAKKQNAGHTVVVSHSQDAKKNPLSSEQKLKHLKRYSPDTHIEASSKEHPTFLQHAAKLHKQGVSHLHLVVGSDRVKEMHDKLHQYNGTHPGALYNFKKITVHSAGHRDPDAEGTTGMSGTKMREHAKNKDLASFKKGVPSHVSEPHAKELMHDVRKGMGLHESYNHGKNKAIFVTGGPGSGKDVVIRECIAEQNITEFNLTQVMDILNDKHKLAMRSMNPRMESIRIRGPLIINGPADDSSKIAQIKEELEELGYETMMIFVDTTDLVSKERNTLLSRMMAESIRHDRWAKSQQNIESFTNLFTNFVRFDNTGELENKIDDITETYKIANQFLSGGVDSNTNRFLSLYESKITGAKPAQKANLSAKGLKVLKDNNSPFMQFQAKLGKRDDVRDGDISSNTGYSKIGGQPYSYAEGTQPTVIIPSQPKETNFSKDANKIRLKKFGDRSLKDGRVGNMDGVGSTFDTRGSTPAAGAGLGDQGTYREDIDYNNDDVVNFAGKPKLVNPNPLAEKKKLKKFKESIFDFGQGDSGVGGTLGGAGNKEDFVKPIEKFGQSGITIKKKKTGAK
jgi:hypothetical protein